jgi:capsular exopolysaccharide synthesis family protein
VEGSPRLSLPGKPGKEPFVWVLLCGVSRRWRPVAGFGVLAAAAVGVAVWFFLPPPMPTASAKLFVPKKPRTALAGEHPDPPIEPQTQGELVKSRLVLNAAIRPEEVNRLPVLQSEEDPLDWLAKHIKVGFLGPEILQISLSYEDPEQARILVDAVKESYLRDIVNRSLIERGERLKRLTEMMASQDDGLKRKRNSLRELAKDPSGTDTERRLFQQQLLQAQVAATRTQLVRVQTDLRAAKLREDVLSADAPLDIPATTLDRYVDADRRVVESAERLKKAELVFEDFRSRATDPKSSVVTAEAAKLEGVRKEHKALRDRLKAETRDQVRTQSRSDREAKLLLLKQDNMILDQQEKQLNAELDAYAKSLSDNRAVGQDLEPIRFEIKQAEELLGRIRGMIMTLTIEQDTPPRVLELEKAVINKVDTTKRKAMAAGGGATAALLLVAALFGFLEFRQRRIDSVDVVTGGLGIRVFGSMPKPSPRPLRWWRGARPEYGVHVQSEAIACARTMLLHGQGLAAHRIFLVTSPVSGEGKTTVTVQLAASVSQAGRRTLLVDGDLRNPSVHKRLGLPAGPGLCEILRGEASVFDVIQKTSIPGLLLIQAGRWTGETGQALVTAGLGQLFSIWRDQFEFVLIDSSPTLPLADALILGRHADGVILSLMQGVSRVPQATETCERFGALGVRILGAVVNGTPGQGYGANEKYYYGPRPDTTPTTAEAI